MGYKLTRLYGVVFTSYNPSSCLINGPKKKGNIVSQFGHETCELKMWQGDQA